LDGLRLALIIAGIAVVAAVYFWTARRQRIEREAGEFDRFDAWADDTVDPLVDPDELPRGEDRGEPSPQRGGSQPEAPRRDDSAGVVPTPATARAPAGPAARSSERVAPPSPAAVPPAPVGRPKPSAAVKAPETGPPAAGPGATSPGAGDRPADLGDLAGAVASSPGERAEPRLGALDEVQPCAPAPGRAAAAPGPPRPASGPTDPAATPDAARERQDELVVVLHVMARPEARFEGSAVRDALEKQGLRPGEMHLYHYRSEAHPADAPPVFSALNAVKPGTLDPAELDAMRTPGIALVLRLPGIERPSEAFELMHSTAQALAAELGGQLCDERRSTLTRQVLNHLREQIAEHVRRRRVGG
jgi:cell division protein ZipA